MGVHLSKNLQVAEAWFLKLKRAEQLNSALLKDETHLKDICEALFDCKFFKKRIRTV